SRAPRIPAHGAQPHHCRCTATPAVRVRLVSRVRTEESVLRRRFGVFLTGLVRTDLDRTAGHHGRNGVLVHHLADLVAQQHHELVERLDDTLQLDAIDEINRNRHALAAQGIQERILQRLAFGHFYGLPIPVSRTVSLAESNGSAEWRTFDRFTLFLSPKTTPRRRRRIRCNRALRDQTR